MASNNVIAVTFSEESKAYQAFSELRQASEQERIGLAGAAVIERTTDGQLRIRDHRDSNADYGVATGSLIGMLIGVLGGPLGMLLGWGAGALIGSSVDIRRADRGAEVLSEFSHAVPPGQTALLAEVNEFATEVVDSIMTPLGGTVHRRSVDEVLTELESAHAAAEAAQAEARRVMREEKRTERKEKLEERLSALRSRLRIGG